MVQRVLLAALLACAAACTEAATIEDDASSDAGGKMDGFGNGELVATNNSSVKLLGGYNALFDKSTSTCLELVGPNTPAARLSVGQTTEQFGVHFIRSREELADKLDIDLEASAALPALVDAHGTFSLLNAARTTETSVNLLFAIRQDYVVGHRAEVRLGATAAQHIASGNLKQLVRTCGTNWVEGVRFGAYVYVLVGFHATTAEDAEKIAGSLGVKLGIPMLSFGAEFKAAAEKTAKRDDVKVTMHAVSAGVSPRTSDFLAKLMENGLSTVGFSMLDAIRQELAESIADDRCRDSGQGVCADGLIPSPAGYFENVQRHAVPTGVQLGFYDAVSNAVPPATGPDPFDMLAERSLVVRRYLRDYSEIRERIARVYLGEIQPFLAAPAAVQSTYNVVPPGDAADDADALHDLASMWRKELAVGDDVGTRLRGVLDEIETCGSLASVNIFAACTDADARTSPAWLAAEDALQAYAETGRVLPLRVLRGGAGAASEIEGKCESLAVDHRPPTAEEAALLHPMIAAMDPGAAIWLARNELAGCAAPRYRVGDDGNGIVECSPAGAPAEIVCVDAAGLVPRLPYEP